MNEIRNMIVCDSRSKLREMSQLNEQNDPICIAKNASTTKKPCHFEAAESDDDKEG